MAKKRPQRKTAGRRSATGSRAQRPRRAAPKSVKSPAKPKRRDAKPVARRKATAQRTRPAKPVLAPSAVIPPARDSRPPMRPTPTPPRETVTVSSADHRARIQSALQSTVDELRRLGISNEVDVDPRGVAGAVVEEGDAAQASERADFSFARRERLALRITALTDALMRLDRNDYGRCENCGNDIEPGRLRALPEAKTCIRCQEDLERNGPRVTV